MPRLPFHTLDVFTDRPFGGNPLAVFPNATHLTDDLMQRIAQEMNLSETVFVGPPETEGATARVRIFTPAREVPFAGHPTVGTAILLAEPRLGVAGPDTGAVAPERQEILEENVGLVPVVVRPGDPPFAQFSVAVPPEFRVAPHSASELACMIGVEAEDVLVGRVSDRHGGSLAVAPQMVSCGLPYYVIPVTSLDALQGSALDLAVWRELGVADGWADHVYIVSLQTDKSSSDVRVRMFAPGSGVPEDPATGSAAAALGAYLARAHDASDRTFDWVVEQGIEMGRPSVIQVSAEKRDGVVINVRVGGQAVSMCRGEMLVPTIA